MVERTPRALAAVLTASALALAGCSTLGDDNGQLDDEHFGYQVSGPLLTTNAASLQGASTQAQRLSGRLYPGVYVPGPGGEMIPNTDLVKAQALPGAQRRVSYTLSDAAVFSDGTPVTCADYLLTFTAGQLPELFGAHLPLFDDTESLQCTPGAKTFTVVFKEGRGDRWRGRGNGWRGGRNRGYSRVVCRVRDGYYGPVRRCFRVYR